MGSNFIGLESVVSDTSITPYLISKIAFDPKFVEQCWIDRSNLDKLKTLQNIIQGRLQSNEQAKAAMLTVNRDTPLAVWQEITEYLKHEMTIDQEFKNILEIETKNVLYAVDGDTLNLLEYVIEFEEEQE